MLISRVFIFLNSLEHGGPAIWTSSRAQTPKKLQESNFDLPSMC